MENPMKTLTRITLFGLLAFALAFLPAPAVAQQNTLVETTLSAAITSPNATCFDVTSATGISAPSYTSGTAGSVLYIQDVGQTAGESIVVNSVTSTRICGRRGSNGTRAVAHVSGAKVWIATAANWFYSVDPLGACTTALTYVTPYINITNGTEWVCSAITLSWVRNGDYIQFVPASQCNTVQTTSTSTNTFIPVGASGAIVLNSVSNAAAGTTTLVCDFALPTRITATRGAVLKDIIVAVGSQVTAPTSIGTATLGTVTFPVPTATTQTASVVTPVAAGSTVTQLGPTTTVLTVTTAGAFLTFKYTFAAAVGLSTDTQNLHFTVPYLQSAAAAMTLNWPGIWVHYSAPAAL